METWEKLLEKAVRYVKNSPIPQNEEERVNWSLGGGTVLMMEYHHRISKDIDIFLSSPQFLGYFSPRLNDLIERETAYYNEQSEYIKLRYDEGEIDFIVAGRLLDKPYKKLHKFDIDIFCESPSEIIAKKVTYRHRNFAVRDFFDMATVLYHAGNADIQEIETVIAPYAKELQERLQKLNLFDNIHSLPSGNFVHERGKTILNDFLSTLLVLDD